MEAAIRFWNGRGWSSPARNRADQECFDELQLTVPKPNVPLYSEANTEWLIKVYTPASIACMRRKFISLRQFLNRQKWSIKWQVILRNLA